MVRPNRSVPVRRLGVGTRLIAVAVASCYASMPAWALNEADLKAVVGSFTASQTGNVNVLTLTTTTNRTLVEAQQRFNIGANEQFRVLQPSSSSLFLLRVVPGAQSGILERSVIEGSIYSNGQLWLQNAAGFQFTKGAVIDTAGFLATTMAVRMEDFLAARLSVLSTPDIGGVVGSVVNEGTITTHSGGSVYLIGADVENKGIIKTPGGETILAAGHTVSLVDTGTPGVKVEITGEQGNVTNLGEIVATAGRIGMAGVVVRNSGTLNASSVVSEGGRVFLQASKDTYVDGAGRIVATGTKGGRVEVLGERVAVMDQAQIDVSGANGGGTVLVGGDYQGKNPDVKNAAVTYFGREASIKADATDNGDGGKVIVWADDTTRAYGTISARGGANGGNGGFVETSGKQHLSFAADVDTKAPLGKAGTLLLDPTDITITASATPSFLTNSGGVFSTPGAYGADTIGWDYINGALSANNVVIHTSSAGGGAGNITVTGAGVLAGGTNSLSLLAENDLTVDAGATISRSSAGNLTLVAGWNSGSGYTTPTATHASTTGNMTINANITNGGDVTLKSKGAMNVNAAVTSAGAMNVDAGTLAITANSVMAGLFSGGNQFIRVGNAWNANGILAFSANSGRAAISSYGSQTIAFYGSAANTLTLAGGTGASSAGSSAEISASGNQTIVNAGGGSLAITLTGGDVATLGNNAYKDYGGATQQTICTGCATHNSAYIKAGGTQTISATSLSLTGGSAGNENSAHIDSVGTSTINVTGAVTLAGGVSGGAYYGGFGNDGYLRNDASISSDATLNLTAGSVTMTGVGSGSNYGGAFIGGGSVVNVTTTGTGDLSMTAGTGTSGGTLNAANPTPAGYIWHNPVAIGNDRGTPTVTLNVGRDLTMTGAAMGATGGSPAMIGGLDVPATVVINANRNVTLGSATQFADRIGSSVNGSSVTIKSGLGGTGSMDLGKGLVAAGSAGTVTLEAGGTGAAIGQNALGRILAGTLYASTTTPIGAIGLPGLNMVNNVTLSANNAVLYNSASSFKAVSVTSASTTASGTVTLSSLYGGAITLGSVSAGYGVTIDASGTIYESNGAGVTDITASGAGGVTLYSRYGGLSGQLAISADIATSGPVQSRVYDFGGAGYGGIRIRNTTATAPTSVSLQDDGHYSGGVNYYNTSSFTAGAGYSLSTTWSGDVKLGSGGDLTVAGPTFGGPGTTYLSAVGGLTVGAALSRATGNLDLSAGGLLNVANNVSATVGNVSLSGGTVQVAATVTAGAGTASVKGNNITMTSGSVNAGSVDLSGGSLTAYGSSIVGATGVKGDFTGDVRLNDGSTMSASTGSVSLTLRGGNSGLYLNETQLNSPASRVISGSAAADKVNVTFTARTAEGIVIDGVTTDTSVAGGSGLFVGNSSTPAVTGSTLNLVYAAAAAPVANDVISAIISSTSPVNPPPHIANLPPTTGTGDGLTPPGGQTVGGDPETFGGKDEKKEDKKDEKAKKADSGEKKDDKPSKKPVGKCSA